MLDTVRETMTTPGRLDEYIGLFRSVFRRREQALWAGVYVRGLLEPSERKSVETLAGLAELPPDLGVEDAAQALQHFVSHSPWEADELLRRYREAVVRPAARPEGVFVIEDVAFAKQGQHSVGVQRQFAPSHGRKINCQIGVSLHHVSAAGDVPLALRLYLPRGWLRTPDRLDATGVPEANRRPLSRADIALELLDAVRQDGIEANAVVAGASYGGNQEFVEGVAGRGLTYLAEVADDVVGVGGTPPRPVPDATGTVRHVLTNLPPEAIAEELARLAAARTRAADVCRTLCTRFGLDHFEGRSWTGFHHHASLVLLAHGYQLWSGE